MHEQAFSTIYLPGRLSSRQEIRFVTFAMTGNEVSRNNVGYSVGTLYYAPGKVVARGLFVPPSFSSDPNGVTQYWSDRIYNLPVGSLDIAPFNPANIDPLTVTRGSHCLLSGIQRAKLYKTGTH
jgi:hypothetical protein